jgi:hypothetical protein
VWLLTTYLLALAYAAQSGFYPHHFDDLRKIIWFVGTYFNYFGRSGLIFHCPLNSLAAFQIAATAGCLMIRSTEIA